MPYEITMPQLSDTMTEGTLIKWLKKEGDKVKASEVVAEVETDKATMEMESSEAGTLAHVLAREGQKVKVGAVIAVLATSKENAAEVKKQYASGGGKTAATAPPPVAPPTSVPVPVKVEATKPQSQTAAAKPQAAGKNYQFDIVVIGGGPAGYAAAI